MTGLPFILDGYKISYWAYRYCKKVKNDPEIAKNITESRWVYFYCFNIKDDPEIRKNITDPYWAYLYCKNVNKDDKRLLKLARGYKKI